MDTFERFAFLTVATDALFAALSGMILMVAYSFDATAAAGDRRIGGYVLSPLSCSHGRCSLRRKRSTPPIRGRWCSRRNARIETLTYARERLQTTMLVAAKNGAGIASAMFASDL